MDEEKARDRSRAFERIARAQISDAPDAARADLETVITHPFQLFRIQAAEALGQLKSPQSVPVLAMALNDRSERVASAAAHALANIGTPEALEVLRCAFVEDVVERPNYLANSIALFGRDGFAVLACCAQSTSPTLRYFAARGLGSTGLPEVARILEKLETDMEKTPFGGAVATGAKAGLKTLRRMLGRNREHDMPRTSP